MATLSSLVSMLTIFILL
ncbi:hypothetical protein LINPERHAP1_LOCUS39123 [Linum perenne]